MILSVSLIFDRSRSFWVCIIGIIARSRWELFRFCGGEFRRLSTEFNSRYVIIIATLGPSASFRSPILSATIVGTSLLPISFPLCLILLLSLFFLSVEFFRGSISILFKLLLCQQEVDLHPLFAAGENILFMDANHFIEGFSLILLWDLK